MLNWKIKLYSDINQTQMNCCISVIKYKHICELAMLKKSEINLTFHSSFGADINNCNRKKQKHFTGDLKLLDLIVCVNDILHAVCQ